MILCAIGNIVSRPPNTTSIARVPQFTLVGEICHLEVAEYHMWIYEADWKTNMHMLFWYWKWWCRATKLAQPYVAPWMRGKNKRCTNASCFDFQLQLWRHDINLCSQLLNIFGTSVDDVGHFFWVVLRDSAPQLFHLRLCYYFVPVSFQQKYIPTHRKILQSMKTRDLLTTLATFSIITMGNTVSPQTFGVQ